MRLKSLRWSLTWLVAIVSGCAERPVDTYYGHLVYEGLPPEAAGPALDDLGLPHAFVLQAAYEDGAVYEYLDLGTVNLTVPKIYVPVRNGAAVTGQYPIIDALPGEETYSPYWQVVTVEVPSDYVANDLKSLQGLTDANLLQTATSEALRCSVINPDAVWLDSNQSQITVFWGTGEVIPNPNYPTDSRPTLAETDAQPGDVVLVPVWHKRLMGFCYGDLATRLALDGDTLADAALGARYEQYEVLPSGGDPGAPWGVLPIFAGGPARAQAAVLTATAAQVTDANDLDTEGAVLLDVVDNPVVRAVE